MDPWHVVRVSAVICFYLMNYPFFEHDLFM